MSFVSFQIREMSNEASAASVREQNLKTELKTLLQSRNMVNEQLKVSGTLSFVTCRVRRQLQLPLAA